jgi:hypothetical protein
MVGNKKANQGTVYTRPRSHSYRCTGRQVPRHCNQAVQTGPARTIYFLATFPAAFVAIGLSTSQAQWQSRITQSGEPSHRTHARRQHAGSTQVGDTAPRALPPSLSPTLETLDGGTRSRSRSSSRRSHVGRQREAGTRVSGPRKAT